MPFLTEELGAIKGEEGALRPSVLALAPWPALEGLVDAAAEAEIGWVVDLVAEIRSARSETNVPAGAQIPLVLVQPSPETRARVERWGETVRRLARISGIAFADAPPPSSVQLIVRGEVAALPLEGIVDLAAERARLLKETQARRRDRQDRQARQRRLPAPRPRGGRRRAARGARRPSAPAKIGEALRRLGA